MKSGENRSSVHSGRAGENAAVEYLKKSGYSIIARNRLICGIEIDIIAIYRDCLCFIEVKTRGSDVAGSPFEFVTPAKQKRYIRAAEVFSSGASYRDFFIRFDIIAVSTEGGKPVIDHLKEAFWKDG